MSPAASCAELMMAGNIWMRQEQEGRGRTDQKWGEVCPHLVVLLF